MKRCCVVLLLGTLAACGGDGGTPPTTPATPAPTPAPVTYNGTYTGSSMTFTGGGGQSIVTCTTTITQTGSNLSFGDMEVTGIGTFVMGSAVMTENNFDGTNQYSSSGCGLVTNHYRGWFSGDGDIMNMTSTLSSDRCNDITLRGEMRR